MLFNLVDETSLNLSSSNSMFKVITCSWEWFLMESNFKQIRPCLQKKKKKQQTKKQKQNSEAHLVLLWLVLLWRIQLYTHYKYNVFFFFTLFYFEWITLLFRLFSILFGCWSESVQSSSKCLLLLFILCGRVCFGAWKWLMRATRTQEKKDPINEIEWSRNQCKTILVTYVC